MAVPAAPLTVAVAADETMTLDAVKVTLGDRGIVVTETCSTDAGPRRLRAEEASVWLVVTDLDDWDHIAQVRALVDRLSAPAVALTTAARGGLWGALLEAGAVGVVSAHTDSDTIERTLRAAAADRAVHPAAEAEDLVARWHQLRDERERTIGEVGSLTAREREVLDLLYAGDTVADIAERFEVAVATVRSQVKSILRKLEVGSQLAAVAAYDRMLRPPRA